MNSSHRYKHNSIVRRVREYPRLNAGTTPPDQYNSITCESTQGAPRTSIETPDAARRILAAFQQNPRTSSLQTKKGQQNVRQVPSKPLSNRCKLGVELPSDIRSGGAKPPKLDYCTHNVIAHNELLEKEHPLMPCYQVNVTKYPHGHYEITAFRSDEPLPKSKKKKKQRAQSREEMSEVCLKRSARRAKKIAKQKAIMLQPNYFLTLTYKENMQDYKKAWSDFDKLRRKLSRLNESFDYVAVQEKQKRGAIHFHILYRNFLNIKLVRYHWNKIVGESCMVNVKKVSKGGHIGKIRVAKYLAKYITKDLENSPGEINSKRYSASKGIPEPEKQTFYMPYSPDPKAMEYQLFKIIEPLGKIRTNRSIETEDWHLQYLEVY